VTPITRATNTDGTPITVGSDPIAIAITLDGTTAYVVSSGSACPARDWRADMRDYYPKGVAACANLVSHDRSAM
jgi:DNA-binding beta-propeller fold protein YncE